MSEQREMTHEELREAYRELVLKIHHIRKIVEEHQKNMNYLKSKVGNFSSTESRFSDSLKEVLDE